MGTTTFTIIICMFIAFVYTRSIVPPQARNKGTFNPSFSKEEVVSNIQTWSALDKGNIWERSGLFEGDIMQEREEGLKNILQDENMRWSNATVPYHIIDEDFSGDEIEIIKKAIEEYHNRTCIKFRPYKKGDDDYVRIESGQPGCWSFVGRRGGGQVVNLQHPACVRHGIVIHELLHALGFYHQQSAHDRDDYVRINWKNILPASWITEVEEACNPAALEPATDVCALTMEEAFRSSNVFRRPGTKYEPHLPERSSHTHLAQLSKDLELSPAGEFSIFGAGVSARSESHAETYGFHEIEMHMHDISEWRNIFDFVPATTHSFRWRPETRVPRHGRCYTCLHTQVQQKPVIYVTTICHQFLWKPELKVQRHGRCSDSLNIQQQQQPANIRDITGRLSH